MSRSPRQSHLRPRRRHRALGLPAPAPAKDRQLQTRHSKEQEDEIQQAPRGPGNSMSRAPAGGDEPGTSPGEKLPTALVPRCPLRLLPPVKALRSAAAASRTGRT